MVVPYEMRQWFAMARMMCSTEWEKTLYTMYGFKALREANPDIFGIPIA